MKQTALITGASRGIGAALAETFARAGYQLTLCCQHSEEKLMTLSKTAGTISYDGVGAYRGCRGLCVRQDDG